MYSSTLERDFLDSFINSEEAWVAVGLLGNSAMSYVNEIKGNLHLLVGIDLPTPPDVLRELMKKNTRSEVHFRVHSNPETFFHPKLYIIRNNAKYLAYVGSGNFTKGGWDTNIELFWKVEKEGDCLQLIEWFNHYMNTAILIDDAFIMDYEKSVYRPNNSEFITQRERVGGFKTSYNSDYQQFFRQEDFDAFTEKKAKSQGELAKSERKRVSKKLYELHDRVYPAMLERGFQLFPNERKQDRVSRWWHGLYLNRRLDGIWLYYGKSTDEILACQKYYQSGSSPNDHVRLQIIVRPDIVGIWCAVGKSGGSQADREAFNQKIQDASNRELFYNIVKNLGDEYFIDVAGQSDISIKDIKDSATLYREVNKDINHLQNYFIIGMSIEPNDVRLRDDLFVPFIIEEFAKLYPLYEFIKAPRPE